MGFEQLAELKGQLAKQAEVKHIARLPRRRHSGAAACSAPVDPVVIAIGKMQKRFPRAFPKRPAPKVPLKIGIFEDLLSHSTKLALTNTELRAAMKAWCRGSRYWTCLTKGAVRIDLSGSEAGRVSPEDASRALKLEESRLTKAASKAVRSEKIG